MDIAYLCLVEVYMRFNKIVSVSVASLFACTIAPFSECVRTDLAVYAEDTADVGSDTLNLGDINSDGLVDAVDASLILAEYARLSTGSDYSFSENQIAVADANSDGLIDAVDATSVLVYYSYVSTGGTMTFKEYNNSIIVQLPIEEISNIVDIDSVGDIPLIAMSDETDYFYLDRTQGLVAKKTGYYSGVFSALGETLETVKMYEYAEGNVIGIVAINPLYNQYIAYSEDGKTITKVFEVQPLGEDLYVEKEPTLQVQTTLVETTDTTAVFNIKVSIPEDAYIGIFSIYKDDGTGGWSAYDALESELPLTAGVGLDYNYTFRENGTFYIKIRASGENEHTTTIHVSNINTDVKFNAPFIDNEPPVLTITTDNITGLSTLTPFNIHVEANEVCDICIDGRYTYDTQVADVSVLTNGVYTVMAIDSNGNKTTEYVTVTAFENGVAPEDFVPINKVNMNPLNEDNKDNFWENAANRIF